MSACRTNNFLPTNLVSRLGSVVALWLVIGAAAFGQSRDAEVAQIVRELKSDRFENRQQATRKLFEMGPEILPALEKVERSASLEQNRRLENIKTVFRAIKAGQTSPAARRAWLDFNDVGFETRDLILEKLLTLKEYEAHFALLEKLQPQDIREVFEDNGYYYSQIVELCRGEQWELIDRLLSMPLMWKYQPILCTRFHFLMGTLDSQITQLQKRLDDRIREATSKETSPKFRADEELNTLIDLLVFQRQYETAGRYIAKIPEKRLRLERENQLLLERGGWKELAERAVMAEADFDYDQPHFSCTPWQYVLLKQYGQGVQAGVKAIDDVEAAHRANGTFDEGFLASLSILTCDWEKAQTGVDLQKDIESLKLLSVLSRSRELEELIGAGVTFESRSKWAQERREEIGELVAKMERESARRGNNDKFNKLKSEVAEKVNYYIYVCEHWRDLGLAKEAILFLREVYLLVHDVEQLVDVKKLITKAICYPARSDVTWSFLSDAGFSDTQMASIAGNGTIFGDPRIQPKVALAQFLNGALYESVKDHTERLQRISFLLDSTVKPTDPDTVNELYPDGFDLDAELARVSHNSTRTSCWQISRIYQYHRRHREAQQWKELAALKGQADALFSLAEEALTEGDFADAARMFDEHFLESSKAYSLGLSSHAWEMAGEDQIAKQRMFYASVVPQHYGSSINEFYRDYISDERGAWVCELARMDTIVGVESSLYPEIEILDIAMNCWKLADPIESANFGKRRTLKLSPRLSAGNIIQYRVVASFNIDGRTRDVMSAVEAGDFEAAKSIFDQVNQFSPGSPSLVEKVVPRLDELGQVELADYFTQRTALLFEDILVRYPKSPVNRNNYAWLLACAQRRLDTVLRHAELAVQLQPQEHTYIDTLAESHFARGEYDEAIETIERSIVLDPPRRYYRNQLKKYQAAKAGQ